MNEPESWYDRHGWPSLIQILVVFAVLYPLLKLGEMCSRSADKPCAETYFPPKYESRITCDPRATIEARADGIVCRCARDGGAP